LKASELKKKLVVLQNGGCFQNGGKTRVLTITQLVLFIFAYTYFIDEKFLVRFKMAYDIQHGSRNLK
jgi:hypothetical protein